MKRTGFLITARLKSTRLPMKILKDLKGRKVIERIIDRAKAVEGISDIVLCTSTNPQDRPLIDIAAENGIYYYAGSEDDVLSRLLDASKLFDMDYFISVTADTPLFSIPHANNMVKTINEGDYDFLKEDKDFLLGGFGYSLKVKALELACKIKRLVDTEIWGYYFLQPSLFNYHTMDAEEKYLRPDARLTLDYPEDYELLKTLHESIGFDDVLSFDAVIDYLDANPELLEINSDCRQLPLNDAARIEIDNLYKEHAEEFLRLKEDIYGTE